jgi:hypothetical protein
MSRRGEARRGDLLPATRYLPFTTTRQRADTWQGANMLALHQHYRDKDAKYWKGEREEKGGGEEEREEGEARNPLPSILYSLPRQPAHAAPIDA